MKSYSSCSFSIQEFPSEKANDNVSYSPLFFFNYLLSNKNNNGIIVVSNDSNIINKYLHNWHTIFPLVLKFSFSLLSLIVVLFIIEVQPGPPQISMMRSFATIVKRKAANYCSKVLHFGAVQGVLATPRFQLCNFTLLFNFFIDNKISFKSASFRFLNFFIFQIF